MKEKEYKRLHKKTKRIYLGKDHILCISSGFTEDYKRFYFKDIQAIVVCKTPGLITRNAIFGSLSSIFFLLSFKAASGNISLIIYLTIAAIFLSLFVINFFKGPTCVVNLYTAVSTIKLSSLNRIKIAMKAVDILNPLIESAQGSLTPEEIIAKSKEMAEKQASISHIAPVVALSEEAQIQQPLKYYNGKAHEILFYILLFCGAGSFLNLFFQNITITSINTFLGLLLIVVTIIALVKQANTSLRQAFKIITWITLVYIIISNFLIFFISMFYALGNHEMYDELNIITVISNLSPFDNPLLAVLFLGDFIFSYTLGTVGLIFLRNFRKKYHLQGKPVHNEQPDSAGNL